MKIFIHLSLLFICCNIYSQNYIDSFADSGYVFPDSFCVSCNGSMWQNPINGTLISPDYSHTFLLPANECNGDSCYYSREFRFYNYGFNIPPNASIDSLVVFIFEGASVLNVIVDSVAQLMKNHTPVGNNYAYPYPWLLNQSVYYPFGLFGTTLTAQEINDPGFGFILSVKNISNDTASAQIKGSHITVWYSTPSGVFSQTSEPNLFAVCPNPSNGSFTIDFHQSLNLTHILLTDLLGNFVLEQQINNKTKIKINNLPGGTYILTVLDKNNIATGRRIISCR